MELPNFLRRWLAGFQVPSTEEVLDRMNAEQQQRALQARLACVDRLRPFVGRLLLVTDYGSYLQEDHIDRIARAIVGDQSIADSAVYGPDTPIGISAHMMASRGSEGRIWQMETAAALLDRLQASGLAANSEVGFHFIADETRWLETIAETAEHTAERAGRGPEEVGHIAVVGAMEMRNADINIFRELPYDNGAAYLLSGIGEHSTLDWMLLSADMG